MNKIVLILFFLQIPCSILPHQVSAISLQEPIVISEFMTTGCVDEACLQEDGRREFIELYNVSNSEVDVSGWRLQYLSSSGATVTDIVVLSGTIGGLSYVLFAYLGYESSGTEVDVSYVHSSNQASGVMAKSGGHIRLVNATGEVVDMVGWGAASANGVWPKVAAPGAGQSIQRLLPTDNQIEGTAPLPFGGPSSITTPRGGGYIERVQENLPPIDETENGGEVKQFTCEGVIISELLPNPSGADSGREYIELFNPTDETINLYSCELKVSNSSRVYTFSELILEPKEFAVLSDAETGLTLPNSSGATVWLMTKTEEIYSVTYPGGLGDDIAWNLIAEEWRQTYEPTPGRQNVDMPQKPCGLGEYRNENGKCASMLTESALVPCREGQERNPETNRCRSILTAVATLVPCAEGQERNPATNRCRSVLASTNTLVPCKEGQERNPETNRCRSVASATELKPCDPGQERNPETNRCRKVSSSGANTLASVTDFVGSNTGTSRLFVAGAAILFALGYAVYEWRQDIAYRLQLLRGKLLRK